MTKKRAYFCFILCIVFEQMGNLAISYTEGFTKFVPSLLCMIFYGICYFFFAKSLKVINLAIGFAVWSGVSIVVVACISVFMLHSALNWADFLGMGIIINRHSGNESQGGSVNYFLLNISLDSNDLLP